MSENKKVDISIIVLVYNHEKYIAKALDSILEQETKYTYEILIGEDCSPDGSRAIIKEYEKKRPEVIRAFYRKENLGATKNGYALGQAARGRYIALLEGDDYWCDSHKLQRQADFLDLHPEYMGTAHNFIKVDQDDKIISDKCISESDTDCDFTWQDFLDKMFLFQSATLMYRNFFLGEGDYTILYKAHDLVGDLTVLTILLNRGNIYILPQTMSAYREVISNAASNARSLARRDEALSNIKTVRQYAMLRPYMNNKTDFNPKIIEKKACFIIEMARHKKGYTFKRWLKLWRYGDRKTNVWAFALVIRMTLGKIRK